jgi:hypothetical protein
LNWFGATSHTPFKKVELRISSKKAPFGALKKSNQEMERVEGIEPSPPAWKAGTLPLSYTRIHSLIMYRRQVTIVPISYTQ